MNTVNSGLTARLLKFTAVACLLLLTSLPAALAGAPQAVYIDADKAPSQITLTVGQIVRVMQSTAAHPRRGFTSLALEPTDGTLIWSVEGTSSIAQGYRDCGGYKAAQSGTVVLHILPGDSKTTITVN